MSGRRAGLALAVLVLFGGLTGCVGAADDGAAASPNARPGTAPASGPPCLTPPSSAPQASAAVAPQASAASPGPDAASPAGAVGAPAAPATAGGEAVPDLSLPCLDGGAPVRIAAVGAPMVINLWASWCAPCRAELPHLQRYADRAGDRVRVVGVATTDRPASARALVGDLGLRLPMLVDEEGAVLSAVGRTALPVTIFVDARGRVAHVHNARALDEAALAALVTKHLGVTL